MIDAMPAAPHTTPDSPSRQLLHELSQLAISSQESFYAKLENDADAREVLHKRALLAAAAEHERVRHSVELERQLLESQIRAERTRREADAQRELRRREKEAADREFEQKRLELEQTRREGAERARIIALEKAQSEAKRQQQQEEEREAAAASARTHALQEEAKERAEQAQARSRSLLQSAESKATAIQPDQISSTDERPSLTNGLPVSKSGSSLVPKAVEAPSQDRRHEDTIATPGAQLPIDHQLEERHQRYLVIHKKLKELRAFMMSKAKEDKNLKTVMGDMRRQIIKSVGQLTEGKGANRQPLSTILNTLKDAAKMQGPKVDLSLFLAQIPGQQSGHNEGAALLVYLLNIFSKAVISQFIDEAGVSPKAADPVGIIASHIFANADFKCNGDTLIDILLAKYHIVCPVLFGIYGSETSATGKARLGWWRECPDGPFISQQRHYERMTGLGAGYAALSLRNYEKSKQQNPYPDQHYWESLARIANVPPSNLTSTHFVVLKGMIENYEGKFIGFYGEAAIVALRLILIDLPKRANRGVASQSLAALVDVFKKDKNIIL